MRLAAVLLTALALAACGRASFATHAPLLATPGLQPGLRPGLWVQTLGACPFDETLPASRWPPCASAILVSGNQFVEETYQDNGRSTRSVTPFVLSSAEPHVLQRRVADHWYDYAVLTPASADRQGHITAANWSLIDCYQPMADGSFSHTEPSPEAGGPVHEGDHGSPKGPNLLPGLTELDGGCTTRGPTALFNTARVFAPHGAFEVNFRWVRDALPGTTRLRATHLRAWSRAALVNVPDAPPAQDAPTGEPRPVATGR